MPGTRGWILQDTEADKEIIVCMHFPPTNNQIKGNAQFIKLMQKYNVTQCYYGHLHGEGLNDRIEGEIGKIKLKLVSADGMEVKLEKL